MAVALRAVSSDADLERIIGVRVGVDPLLETTADDLRFLASRLRGPLHLLATVDGKPAGFGFAGVFPEQEAEPFAFADVGVLQEFRRRGVGSALHAALSGHVRGLGKDGLQLEVPEQDVEAIEFFQKRGYVEVERQKAVELDLTAREPEPPQLPSGVEVFSWAERPDLAAGMYEVYRGASDIPGLDGETGWTAAEWRVRELERPSRRYDLSFLAVADDEVVGYATLDVFPAGGFHGLTAVAPAWRRRGVGRALKRSQIAAAKEAGLEKLYTESEERNEPMRRLNEELGFRPIPGMIVLRGPLV